MELLLLTPNPPPFPHPLFKPCLPSLQSLSHMCMYSPRSAHFPFPSLLSLPPLSSSSPSLSSARCETSRAGVGTGVCPSHQGLHCYHLPLPLLLPLLHPVHCLSLSHSVVSRLAPTTHTHTHTHTCNAHECTVSHSQLSQLLRSAGHPHSNPEYLQQFGPLKQGWLWIKT